MKIYVAGHRGLVGSGIARNIDAGSKLTCSMSVAGEDRNAIAILVVAGQR